MLLHKYTKAQRGLSYLREGYLRFSPVPEFNDPFEMRPCIDSLGTPAQIEEKIQEIMDEDGVSSPELKAALIQQAKEETLPILRERAYKDLSTLGVLCLVKESPYDLLMWAHYADSHRGCVLEFNGSHEWFRTKHGRNPDSLLGILREVRYLPSRPKVSLLTLSREDLLVKDACWGYEHEWRIMLNLRDCTSKTVLDPCGKEKRVEGLFPVPHDALANVYLGVNIDQSDREQFLELLPPGQPVGLFQVRLDEQEFALVARQIN